jgi:hypothetical protein
MFQTVCGAANSVIDLFKKGISGAMSALFYSPLVYLGLVSLVCL